MSAYSGSHQNRTRFDLTPRFKRENPLGDEDDEMRAEDYSGEEDEQDDDDESPMGRLETLVRFIYGAVKHYLPQLALVAVLIPVLLLVSFVAGWLVRKSAPTGVEERVYLQYGYVHIQISPLKWPSTNNVVAGMEPCRMRRSSYHLLYTTRRTRYLYNSLYPRLRPM